MADGTSHRVKLSGGPAGSTSSAYFAADGTLVVECYDHGEEAEAVWGNDVAFLVHLDLDSQQRLAQTLAAGEPDGSSQRCLPERLAQRFESYFEVRKWLDQQGIPYRHEFDSWA